MYGFKFKNPENTLGFLLGKELIQICLSPYQIILRLQSEGNQCASISIESPFEVDADGKRFEFKDGMLDSVENLYCLFGSSIAAFNIKGDRELEIVFSNGGKLTLIDNSEKYESFIFYDHVNNAQVVV